LQFDRTALFLAGSTDAATELVRLGADINAVVRILLGARGA
jgi:hypothetical protein